MKRLFTAMTLATLMACKLGSIALAQEVNDPVKVAIYKRFVDNRGPKPEAAYEAAKEYLAKYEKDNDKYTNYIQKWVMYYERAERKRILPTLINQKKLAEAFRIGALILAGEPNYLPAQIALAYAGYLAASKKDETHNT